MNDMPTDTPRPLADEASFRTYGRHMRLAHRLGLDLRRRPPGVREIPELVRLDVAPGRAPSGKPPVRIYVGTEPAQHRAERVLLWSIMKLRDPSRVYEVHLMKDLAAFDRRHWKTGFTGYRYAIPALAGGHGRAIYNDVDQIYLGDPAELFDLDMKGAGMLEHHGARDLRHASRLRADGPRLAPRRGAHDAPSQGIPHQDRYMCPASGVRSAANGTHATSSTTRAGRKLCTSRPSTRNRGSPFRSS